MASRPSKTVAADRDLHAWFADAWRGSPSALTGSDAVHLADAVIAAGDPDRRFAVPAGRSRFAYGPWVTALGAAIDVDGPAAASAVDRLLAAGASPAAVLVERDWGTDKPMVRSAAERIVERRRAKLVPILERHHPRSFTVGRIDGTSGKRPPTGLVLAAIMHGVSTAADRNALADALFETLPDLDVDPAACIAMRDAPDRDPAATAARFLLQVRRASSNPAARAWKAVLGAILSDAPVRPGDLVGPWRTQAAMLAAMHPEKPWSMRLLAAASA